MSEDANERLWRGPTLVLDSATAVVHAGILLDGRWAALEARPGEALENVFRALEIVLKQAGLELAELRNVALGIGPGSILGLRLSLMALHSWRQMPGLKHWKLYQFSGLRLSALQRLRDAPGSPFHLISDFRRGTWHHLGVADGRIGDLQLLEDTAVAALSEKIYYIPTGRGSQEPPAGALTHTFSLSKLPDLHPFPWAIPTDLPELYLPAPPVFKTWNAQIHGKVSGAKTG